MKSKNRIQNPDLYVINCMQFSECKPPLARQLSLIHYDSNEMDKTSQEGLTGKSSPGLTLRVALGAMAAFLTNSLPSGFNMGVVNTPEQIFKDFFNVSLNDNQSNTTLVITKQQIEFIWSLAVSLLIVGALLVALFAGSLANLIGRRRLIFLNSLIGIAGVAMCWLSKYTSSVSLFLAGRLVSGFHTGIASSVCPMYLMEIAPKSQAGHMGILHVMGLNGGIFLAQLLGLEAILGSATRWPLLFFVNAVFLFLGQVLLLFAPESPIYLFVMKNEQGKAVEVLQAIRQQRLFELADEVEYLKEEQKNREQNTASFLQLMGQSEFRKGLLIVCVMHAGQQLCGINAVFYYSTSTFKSVGLGALESQYGSITCSLLNTIAALISIHLMSRYSPRKLLLVSTVGTTIALITLTTTMTFNVYIPILNYGTIFAILLYVCLFAIGQGPIPFTFGGEIFDTTSLAIGLSCGCFVNWLSNVLVAITFPLLALHIKQYVFTIFIIFDVLLLVFIVFKVPETRTPTASVEQPVKETCKIPVSVVSLSKE